MAELQTLLYQGLHTLLVLALPIAAVVSVGGILVAALQAATAIREDASYYSARLGLVLLVGYFLLATAIEGLTRLAQACFGQ